MFELPGSVLGYDHEDCQDHHFFALKHQEVMQNTIYSLKIMQIY